MWWWCRSPLPHPGLVPVPTGGGGGGGAGGGAAGGAGGGGAGCCGAGGGGGGFGLPPRGGFGFGFRPGVTRSAGTCRPAAVRRRSGGHRADEHDRMRLGRMRGRPMRRRRSQLRLLGPECLLPRDSCRVHAQASQRVEQIGARLEVERRRYRDHDLLRRVLVERGTPQVSGTHRSCDKCRQPDRMRRQHGQQFAGRVGRRLGRVLAREHDAVLALLLRAVESAVRRPQEPVDGLRVAELGDPEAGRHHDRLPHAERDP